MSKFGPIIILEDDPEDRELIQQALRELGVRNELRFFGTGQDALYFLMDTKEQPLLIISDINMPGMDGLALLREIKARQPDLPVMMVTAYGDDERQRLADEYGAEQFITKPVDFDLLKAQLRQLQTTASNPSS